MVIERCFRSFLTVTKNVLLKVVREELGVESADRRLMSAILNHRLHLGKGDVLECESIYGKRFSVYVSAEKTEEVESALAATKRFMVENQVVAVTDVEELIFGNRHYNTFSSSGHLLSRLVRLGFAENVDKSSFRIPEGLNQCLVL